MAAMETPKATAPVGPDDPAFQATFHDMIEHDRARALTALGALTRAQPTSVPAWAMLMTAHHRCLDFAACAEAAARPRAPPG